MSEWRLVSEGEPDVDGRYAVIYKQGGVVKRFIADYSVADGWMIGLPDVEVLAWCEMPGIPRKLLEEKGWIA